MRLVLDAGALIACERGDTAMIHRLEDARRGGGRTLTHGGVVGQVWRRGGSRQAALARALAAIEVLPLDERLGRRAGELLARTGGRDVIDAALVVLCEDDDMLLTSDPRDLVALAEAWGRDVDIVSV